MPSYTEAEAKTKWCPFAPAGSRVVDVVSNVTISGKAMAAKDVEVSLNCNCLGSQCMAWRWDRLYNPESVKGYCGLAGDPRSK